MGIGYTTCAALCFCFCSSLSVQLSSVSASALEKHFIKCKYELYCWKICQKVKLFPNFFFATYFFINFGEKMFYILISVNIWINSILLLLYFFGKWYSWLFVFGWTRMENNDGNNVNELFWNMCLVRVVLETRYLYLIRKLKISTTFIYIC